MTDYKMNEEMKRSYDIVMERERKFGEWVRSLTIDEIEAYMANLDKEIEKDNNELLLNELCVSMKKMEL